MNRLGGSLSWRLLLHVLASGQLSYSVHYELRHTQLPVLATLAGNVPPLGGKFNYLSFLNGLLQTLYYLLAVACDLRPLARLQQTRSFLLTTLVVPLALTVSATFWLLWTIDEELVFPYVLVGIYPWWLTYTLHTLVAVGAVLEICVAPHRYPSRRRGFTVLAVVLCSYLAWLQLVYHWTGIWIYPFLDIMNSPFRWVFFALVGSSACVFYLLGERLNCVLWGQL
ncbi:hypothetical protein KR093_008786 [Drosophila rubida]|uniref:Androgen-dependent TFPI-regulating protein n=1 Tax=Drosophila rubida TaxID=30044 RepID=A0AAD4K1A0_9MUSC|nr:hypothetical protein KR093_008786 [Drosophila rubida]